MDLSLYPSLSLVFAHPEPTYGAEVRAVIEVLDRSCPEAAQELRRFCAAAPLGDASALEELYVRTFHIQPITSLDMGYTLFGEDYKRGALLAHLSREHTTAGNDCGVELADHVVNVLRLLPLWQDASVRDEFVRVLLGPAVREMIREFEPDRLDKKEQLYKRHHKTVIETASGEARLSYRHALRALDILLTRDFQLEPASAAAENSMFVGSVDSEMDIENCNSCATK